MSSQAYQLIVARQYYKNYLLVCQNNFTILLDQEKSLKPFKKPIKITLIVQPIRTINFRDLLKRYLEMNLTILYYR